MSKTREQYTEANRRAWNEVASRHAAVNNDGLFEDFRNPAHVSFDEDMLQTLKTVGVEGRDVIHLCCNNARETLSISNMGARYCVGVDAAEQFLAHGNELIRIAGAEDRIELIHSDVYFLPERLNGAFDIVLCTIGVIGWMPDLEGFFRVIKNLLKPGGRLVMQEMHPVLLMYDEDPQGGKSSIQFSYFNQQVWEETAGLDYYSRENYDASPCYSFMYRMDQILMAGIDNGLQLRSFKELDYDISLFCPDLEKSDCVPPLGFIMVMQAQADDSK